MRRVRPEEWDDLRALRLRALGESPDSFGSTELEARQREDEDWRAWARDGGRSGERAVFVAEADGKLVGLCGSFLHENGGRTAQIVSMWVDPHYRGNELGARLLEAAAGWSAEQGAEELVLDVTETNAAARRLYRRAGFSETGHSEPLRSNRRLLTVQMAKPLRVEVGGDGVEPPTSRV